MIHVLNFNSQIIDFISRDDNAVTLAKYHKTKDNDLLDIRILSQRAEHFKKRNRIIIKDKNDVYREYIIDRAEEDGRYVDVECTASHLVDISTSKPIPPGKYEKMTINQKLSETLRDSGWVVGDCDYAGLKTNYWTSVRTPLEMISQLETAHEVQADYEIEIDGYEVVERRVNMKIPLPLFKGKEIEYGKDLLSMKRVIDFSEVKTALYALGPEPEQGKRVETFVYDDEAQEQFDLPYRYIWGVYEPETEDDTMSLQRLTTLAKTELNKRKSAAVSYEISVVDIEKEFPHEVIRYGDIVRIKNPDFTPALYAESEVVGIEHDLISNKCTYEFGKVVEYQEDDLLRYFRSKLSYFNQKLNDNFANVNTIVRESIDGELQYYERKIFKGSEAPENPVNDVLWLDTSNHKVAVLRRFWNGEWIKSSAENAEDVGAVTREQAMYHDLKNTFINLNIQHSKLLSETHEILNSEYFVNNDLKSQVNAKLNDTIQVFNEIKQNLDSMTEETATIGKLVDTQNLFLTYREKLQALYNVVENAKIAINERFKLLQSQYTDEKFNDAMSKVASTLPNGRWDTEKGQLTSDIPNEERLQEIQQQLSIALSQNIAKISTTLQNYTDSEVKNLKDEISASVRSIKEDVQSEIDSVSINVTEAKNSLKILQDSLLLTATKEDVTRTLNEQLEPIQNDVNEQKAQLKVMSDSIDSKVSQSDYTTDKNNIVQRLDSADSQRQQLSNQISDRVTLTQFNGGIDSTKQYADDKFNDLEIGNVNLIRSYRSTQNIANGTIEGDYAVRLPLGRNINFYYYDRNGDINPPLEPNTDYVLQLHEADADVDMGVFYNQGKNTISPYSRNRIVKFNTGDKTDFRIVIVARADNQFVGKVSLYKGTKELDWTPNPLDVQTNIDNAETNAKAYADSLKRQQDEVLTMYDTRITQNGKDIEQRATKEEYNASKQLLDKTIAQVVTSAINGVSLSYNDNGTISDLVLNNQGVSLNSRLININQGDVVIENGVTTIKNLSAEKIKVAFNNITNSVNINPSGLETVENGTRTSLLNGVGHHFFYENKYVGHIGTGSIQDYPDERGLRLTLDDYGKYMAFSYRTGKLNPGDPNQVAMLWSKGSGNYSRGFHFNEDIKISSDRVLEALYVRPNGAEPKYRLTFRYGQFSDVDGTYIKYNSVNGSGVHFSNNVVSLIARSGTDGYWSALSVHDGYVKSITVYNRTYSGSSNLYITSNGVIGRSTSASKYKLSQEKQFVDEEEQYNHSKQLLNLDIKTWFDKFESETYAREILTGERQEEEDFKLRRYAGLIAEDVESVGLKEFVTYGKDKEVEGIEYDRLWIHLIPVIKRQNEEIEKLKSEMEVLKNAK
ncbi:phage tail spike protein [Staphylococcus felis]|uniref:phage tail spike protein n=1 Tax=Staphylococcus felis TaxID=46127 RepID=UPI003967B94F